MIDYTIQTGKGDVPGDWVWAIRERLEDELPYDDDNKLVAEAVKQFLVEHPDRIEEFVGTTIIETDYFDSLEDGE